MPWHRAYRSLIYAEWRACDDRTAEVRLTETDMTILKLVLIGSLRIVVMGSLKVALFVGGGGGGGWGWWRGGCARCSMKDTGRLLKLLNYFVRHFSL